MAGLCAALVGLLLLLAAPRHSRSSTPSPPSCGCAGFCGGGCAFNATPPRALALFRRTPADDLRLADHDTATAAGGASHLGSGVIQTPLSALCMKNHE